MRFKLCQKSRRDISIGYIATYNDYALNGLRVFQYGIRITENRPRSFAIKVVKITTKHIWKVCSSNFYLRVYISYCSADFTNQAFNDQPAIRCIQIEQYCCHLNNLGAFNAGYRVKRCDLMKSGGVTAYCPKEMMIKPTRTYHFSNNRQPFGNNSPIIVFCKTHNFRWPYLWIFSNSSVVCSGLYFCLSLVPWAPMSRGSTFFYWNADIFVNIVQVCLF